jgi:hypothetical protein
MPQRSERVAWQQVREGVKRILQLTVKEADRFAAVRDVAWQLDSLAADMLDQVRRGVHANPPLVIYGNPPKGGELMSRRVYAVEYKHAGDGEDYRHDCGAGVNMYAVGKGILLQRPDGKPLSREFDV